MMESLYVAHNGWLQRADARYKLGLLMLAGTALFFLQQPAWLAAVLGVVALLLQQSGVGWQRCWRQMRGLLVLWALVVGFMALLQGWQPALVAGLRLATLMGLALVVSFTTTTAAMIDAVEALLQPLARRGWVRADRFAFSLGLVLRFVPELQRRWAAIREAQAARGIRASPVTLVVPLVVAILQSADAIAEALDARGYD